MANPVRQDVLLTSQQNIGLAVQVDVLLSEQHEVSMLTTQYPVESGSDITEHAVRKPAKLVLEGAVSTFRGDGGAAQPLVPMSTWEQLLGAMDERELINVTTLLGVYPNMLIRKAQTRVDETTGHNLLFSLELQEIIIVDELQGLRPTGTPTADGPAAERTGATVRGLQGLREHGDKFIGPDTIIGGEPAGVTGDEGYA